MLSPPITAEERSAINDWLARNEPTICKPGQMTDWDLIVEKDGWRSRNNNWRRARQEEDAAHKARQDSRKRWALLPRDEGLGPKGGPEMSSLTQSFPVDLLIRWNIARW